MCRDGVRKAKAKLEQDFARDVKNKEKGFSKYLGQKIKSEKSLPPLGASGVSWRQVIWRRLRYSMNSLPQPSLAVRLPASLKSLILWVGVEEVESFPL